MWIRPLDVAEAHAFRSRPFIGIRGTYTERQLWELYVKFGASPRSLALHTSDPDGFECLVTRQIMEVRSDVLRCASCDPENIFDHVFVTLPSPTSRNTYEKRIISRHVFELLWENHLQYYISDMEYFYHNFRVSPSTADFTGWIFEFRIHQLLGRQQTIQIFSIGQDSPRLGNFIYNGYPGVSLTLQLPGSNEHLLVEDGHFHMNRYYRLKHTDFPAIDSLLFLPGSPPTLVVFQITRNAEEHNVSEDSLRSVDKLGLPWNTRRVWVVVTPEGVKPEIKIPMAYFGMEVRTRLVGEGFGAYHLPVPLSELFSTQ